MVSSTQHSLHGMPYKILLPPFPSYNKRNTWGSEKSQKEQANETPPKKGARPEESAQTRPYQVTPETRDERNDSSSPKTKVCSRICRRNRAFPHSNPLCTLLTSMFIEAGTVEKRIARISFKTATTSCCAGVAEKFRLAVAGRCKAALKKIEAKRSV